MASLHLLAWCLCHIAYFLVADLHLHCLACIGQRHCIGPKLVENDRTKWLLKGLSKTCKHAKAKMEEIDIVWSPMTSSHNNWLFSEEKIEVQNHIGDSVNMKVWTSRRLLFIICLSATLLILEFVEHGLKGEGAWRDFEQIRGRMFWMNIDFGLPNYLDKFSCSLHRQVCKGFWHWLSVGLLVKEGTAREGFLILSLLHLKLRKTNGERELDTLLWASGSCPGMEAGGRLELHMSPLLAGGTAKRMHDCSASHWQRSLGGAAAHLTRLSSWICPPIK